MVKNKNVKKPPKKAKKERVTFDKIDITTATEDDIIQSGIRYHTSKDKVCYFVMFLIFVLAITPILLRVSMPKKITEGEIDITYTVLNCSRQFQDQGWQLDSSVKINYRDGAVISSNLEFNVSQFKTTAEPGYVFFDVNELNAVRESPGFVKKQEGYKYTYDLDFKKDKSLLEEETLKKYAYVVSAEIDYLKGRNYRCNSNIETKKEWVNLETHEIVDR